MTDLDKTDLDKTDLDREVDELGMEELEAASGGRIKINLPPAIVAWEIAKIQAENPGFC
jgi:hypothetical protein